jgi:quinol monooxygenase YgiN
MVIVQGVFRVAPDARDAYLAESVETMRTSRSEHGCLEYVLAADPVEPDRVVLSERWATQADLDAHLRALTQRRSDAAPDESSAGAGVEVRSREITVFDVESSRPLG